MKTTAIDVRFAGSMRIEALIGDEVIATDQPVKEGGDGTAPSPFALFLASLATCAGVYAKRFLEARKLSDAGLAIRLECEFHPKRFQIEKMIYHITLPEGFPDKLREAFFRSIDLCAVKKHVCDAPEFEIRID